MAVKSLLSDSLKLFASKQLLYFNSVISIFPSGTSIVQILSTWGHFRTYPERELLMHFLHHQGEFSQVFSLHEETQRCADTLRGQLVVDLIKLLNVRTVTDCRTIVCTTR